jgi:hypothetical protein
MDELLEAKTERIQFEAAKYLDGMDRPGHAVGASNVNVQVNTTIHNDKPGYVIRINRTGDERVQQIEHLEAHGPKPLMYNDDVPADE